MIPCFLAWTTKHFPYACGHLNHIRRLLDSCLPSVVQATRTCLASTLHACAPAIGMPSFLYRIVDVVSINGIILLPTIHVFTDYQGHLSWAFSGVHDWTIQTNNKLRALQQPLARAKQPLSRAQQQPPPLRSWYQRTCFGFLFKSKSYGPDRALTSTATIEPCD